MTEDPNMALNPEGEAETTPATTPVEEKTTETPEGGSEESKKGASARIQELANAKKVAEQRANSLEKKLTELTSQVGSGSMPNMPPAVDPIVAPGEEITADELNNRLAVREQRIQQMNELRFQQERAVNHINQQASKVVGKYSILNPDSDDFNPELSESVTEASLAYARSNPFGDLEGFVGKLVKPYQKAVTKEETATQENIAKQVSQGAIRPSNAKPGEKKFEDLSVKEMESKLGFAS